MTKQQFNDLVLKAVHAIINREDLEHIPFTDLALLILGNIEHPLESGMLDGILDTWDDGYGE